MIVLQSMNVSIVSVLRSTASDMYQFHTGYVNKICSLDFLQIIGNVPQNVNSTFISDKKLKDLGSPAVFPDIQIHKTQYLYSHEVYHKLVGLYRLLNELKLHVLEP